MTKPTGRPPGRPAVADPRDVRTAISLTRMETDAIAAVAQAAGMRPAAWMRRAVLRAAGIQEATTDG